MAPTDLLELIPGARLVDGQPAVGNLDEPYSTPHGFNPPAEWFTTPHHDVIAGASALITADGQFCAFSHEWDRCHVSFTNSGQCWTPPRSVTGNRTFHQSRVQADDGGRLIEIPVGVIPFGDGHAPLDATVAQAQQHYDRPERVRVWARAVEVDDGCVMCGAIVPGTTNRQVALMRASALSGDWRWIPQLNELDFIGPCFVARPGLPLGLEQAAIEQALWSIQRTAELSVSASGQIMAVVGDVVSWAPRPAVSDNVPQTVIAAAMGDQPMQTDQKPCSCSTQTTPVVAAAPVIPSKRHRVTAAAGTGMTYRELDRAIDDALTAAFGTGDDGWVWSRDWDLEAGVGWAVFELERNDPITGSNSGTFQAGISVAADGVVTIDRSNVIEVETVYAPAGTGNGQADVTVDDMPMVAHAAEAAAIAEMRARLDDQTATIEALSADVARLSARDMEPAEVVDELPEAPDPV